MVEDPELFSQVARGGLGAREKSQLYRQATDVGKQMGLMPRGGYAVQAEKERGQAAKPTCPRERGPFNRGSRGRILYRGKLGDYV